MKVLLFLLLVGALLVLPFSFIKQPWAVKLGRRIRLVIVIYVVVVVISAVLRLAFNWDDIYG